MKKHEKIYVLWLESVVVDGLFQSIRLPDNAYLTQNEYYDSLAHCSSLWKKLFISVDWTEETINNFAAKFFQHILDLLEKSDLSYKVEYSAETADDDNDIPAAMDVEAEENKRIQEIIGEIQQVRYVANNEMDMQFFYRVTLLFDSVLPCVKSTLFANYVYPLYKALILKLRKLPRSIVLLKLLKTLNMYIEKN